MVSHLAREQARLPGCKPSVVTLNRLFRGTERQLAARQTIDGIPVRRLAFVGSERYPLCPQVLAALSGADIVHVHGVDFFFDFLALTKHVHRKRLFASTHGGFFHTKFASRLKQVYFRTITKASVSAYRRIIATSRSDGTLFARIVRDDRLCVIENGVDTLKFRGTASRELVPRIIYFGRWSPDKGVLEAIELCAALNRLSPLRWQLTIAGREYDLSESEVRARADRCGVAEAVTIVPGPTTAQLREHIRAASYFVCLSRHEGFGLAAVEAMSAGLVPLLSSIGPFERLVNESGVGLLMTPETDSAAFATRILELHGAMVEALDERKATAQAFSGRFAWDKVAACYMEQYAA